MEVAYVIMGLFITFLPVIICNLMNYDFKGEREYKNKRKLIDTALETRKTLDKQYVYHITNINDLNSILDCGKILCRNKATEINATFSHNTSLTKSVLKNTEYVVGNYVRLAISSANPAFSHFEFENSTRLEPSVELRFLADEISNIKSLKVSEKVANKMMYTFDISEMSKEEKIEQIQELKQYEKAELLIPTELSILYLDEIIIYMPKNVNKLVYDKLDIIKNKAHEKMVLLEVIYI